MTGNARGDLDALAGRYFPPTGEVPTFVEDTEWRPIVDGADYFAQLDAALDDAGPGDSVLITGLEVDPDVDLRGRHPGDPDYRPLGARLARLAARGVHVRLLMAGRVFPSSLPRAWIPPFRANAVRAVRMRELRVEGIAEPPLAGCVLLDFSGALIGSNHQKAVVVHLGGELRAYVGGIDLVDARVDGNPHDRLRRAGQRWGWHDAAVRLRGPGARRVWDTIARRWAETSTLPDEHFLLTPRDRRRLNPADALPVPPAPEPVSVPTPGTAVRVLRSLFHRKIDSRLPAKIREWDAQPLSGMQEVFGTLVTAINAARRYVYLEDQYLSESPGGEAPYELYPYLRAAAERGVKVILLGSGTRDPEDAGLHFSPINRELNHDIRHKIVEALPPSARTNVVVYRVEMCTVHAKLVLVDDVFANIGSANMFSRSMMGTDSEVTAAVVTTTGAVRDLRVQLWAEHLRTPVSDDLRPALEDVDLALGLWRRRWVPAGADPDSWRVPGTPAGFSPRERVLTLVGPR